MIILTVLKENIQSLENDSSTLFFPLSLHTWYSHNGIRLNVGSEPIGDFHNYTRDKRKRVGSIRHLLVSRPLQSGCPAFAAVFDWPRPFSGSSAGICSRHLGPMNIKCNFSPLSQQLCAYSAFAGLQTLSHFFHLDSWFPPSTSP